MSQSLTAVEEKILELLALAGGKLPYIPQDFCEETVVEGMFDKSPPFLDWNAGNINMTPEAWVEVWNINQRSRRS